VHAVSFLSVCRHDGGLVVYVQTGAAACGRPRSPRGILASGGVFSASSTASAFALLFASLDAYHTGDHALNRVSELLGDHVGNRRLSDRSLPF
jgi:hypothetical protein